MVLLSSLLPFDLNAQATAEGDAIPRPILMHAGRTAHPDLMPFAKERNYADDPVEFESPEAEGLWRAIVLHLQLDESGYYASRLKTGGDFIALAGECFLVTYDAVFYVCPGRDVFEQLTPSEVSGIHIGELLSLPDERSWRLVEAAGLHHGIYYSSFTAIVLSRSKDGIVVAKAFPLASAAQDSDDPGSDTPCGEEQDRKDNGFDDQNSGRVISHELIKDAAGYVTKISFILLRQNCKSMKRTNVVEDYDYSENGFSKSETH